MSTMGAILSTPHYLHPLVDWSQVLHRAHRHSKPHPDFIVESIHHYKSIYDGDKQNEILYLHVVPRLPHSGSKGQPSIYILIQHTVTKSWLYLTVQDEVSVLSGEDDRWKRNHHRNQQLLGSLSWPLHLAAPRLLDIVKILINTSRTMRGLHNLRMPQLYRFTRIGYEVVKELYPGNNNLDTGNQTLAKDRQKSWFFIIFGRKVPFTLSPLDHWVIATIVIHWRWLGEGGVNLEMEWY
jgi:hypothetical protein